jgi:hypothetical protein
VWTGEIAWICMTLPLLFTLESVRRRYFELFFYFHQLLPVSVFFAVLHSTSVRGGSEGRLLQVSVRCVHVCVLPWRLRS